MFRATRSSRQSSDYHDFALSSVFRATDQPPTRSALLTHVHRKGTSLAKGSSQPHTLFSAGGFPARSFRESAYAPLRRGRIVSGRAFLPAIILRFLAGRIWLAVGVPSCNCRSRSAASRSSCSANAKRMRSVLPDPEVEIPAARLQSAAFLRSSRARPLVSQCWVGGFKARREVPLTRDAGPMRGEFEDSRQSGPECRAADTHRRLAYSRH